VGEAETIFLPSTKIAGYGLVGCAIEVILLFISSGTVRANTAEVAVSKKINPTMKM
jgi:hypothetical protein